MNIFVTSNCPYESAMALDDKRVNKMILESAQMLCTALYEHGGVTIDNGSCVFTDTNERAYKPTHKNHPCNVWCRETRTNYNWLLKHFKALYKEYNMRRGKVHASSKLYDSLRDFAHYIPEGDITPFANCAARQDMDINYKHLDDACEAYKLYLCDRWDRDKLIPKWTNRGAPTWR